MNSGAMERQDITKAKRIVVKVGTSVLASKGFALDEAWMQGFAREIGELLKQGREVVIVSSGAIAAGMHLLGMKKRPSDLPGKQACAAVGQGNLINKYEDMFRNAGFHVGQILLTWEGLKDRRMYLNAKNTINTLLSKSVVPIINENDTVAVDEIKFGDNDTLSALVAELVGADLLVMLTDVDGFCAGSKKQRVDKITEICPEIEAAAGGTEKEHSLGGMKTKLKACRIAMSSGIHCVIANGRKKDIMTKIIKGENVGTLFVAEKEK